jgi:hypothetical protein
VAGIFVYWFFSLVFLYLIHIKKPAFLTMWLWPVTVVIYMVIKWCQDIKYAVTYKQTTALFEFIEKMNESIHDQSQLNMKKANGKTKTEEKMQ